jgi:hypothetical protein
MRHRRISPAQYRHGKYGLYGAFSIASALLVAGIVVIANVVWLILAALASQK